MLEVGAAGCWAWDGEEQTLQRMLGLWQGSVGLNCSEGGREAYPWQEGRSMGKARGRCEFAPSTFLPENLGRKIQIQRSGHLNLYLLLDASQSVKEEDFHVFKESAILMVDRVRE